MQKHYCLYWACRKADGTANLEDYLQFCQDTDICRASERSLPRACRLFQQNRADNHQVRLNLIKRGGTLPKLNKFRVCCLETVLAVGERHPAGSRHGGWWRAPGCDNQARQTWWRAEKAGRCKGQSGELMEKTLKSGLQHSLLCEAEITYVVD